MLSSSTKNEEGKRDVEMHQIGYVKVRIRGLMKNTAQLTTLLALSNLWMARKKLMLMDEFRANTGHRENTP